MKILHLIYTNGVAGAEKYLLHLLPSLREKGFDCHVIMVCSPDSKQLLENYQELLKSTGTPVTLIITRRRRFLKAAGGINRYLKQHGIKVVHSHLLYSDVLAIMVKLIFYRKLVIISTKHGYNEQILKKIEYAVDSDNLKKTSKKGIYFYVTKFVIKKTNYNYAVSRAASLLYYNLGLIKEIMPFIYHGVTVKQLDKTDEINNYRLSRKQLITVGRLEEIKGHRYLLEAMPMIIKEFNDIKLLIIGEGSEKNNLQQLANRLNINQYVVFMGFNSDPYSYVNKSDVVIIPSLFEPFGLVYIEAFALKTPVVAFDTAAGNEIIQNNITGLLVKPKDSIALAKKIIFLLANPSVAIKIAEAARQRYMDHFSTKRMVDDTAAYYKKIENEVNGN